MKKMLYHCFCLVLLGSLAAQNRVDTIPFFLNRSHNICVRAQINDSDTLILMFHSASTGLSLTQAAAEQKIKLNASQTSEVRTWGGRANAQFSEGNVLKINRLRWDSLEVFINEFSGPGTDGKFGFDFFKGKVLAIDYEHGWLIVYPALPRISKKYRRSKLSSDGNSLFIEGKLKVGREVFLDKFMFHTGYGGSILLDPKIGERYRMQSQLPTVGTSELKDSYGNVIKIETKSLPEVQVGGQRVKNVSLSFAAQSSEIPMKVFGNGLLHRFDVIFDFQNEWVYLRKNRFWGAD